MDKINNNCYVHNGKPYWSTIPPTCTCFGIQQNTFSPPDASPSPDKYVKAFEFVEIMIRVKELERHISLINHLDGAKRDMQGDLIKLGLNIEHMSDRLINVEGYMKMEDRVSAADVLMRLNQHETRLDGQSKTVNVNFLDRIKALEELAHKHIAENEWHTAEIQHLKDRQNPEKYNKIPMSFHEAYSEMVLGKKIKNTNWVERSWLYMSGGKVHMNSFNDDQIILSMDDINGEWVVLE